MQHPPNGAPLKQPRKKSRKKVEKSKEKPRISATANGRWQLSSRFPIPSLLRGFSMFFFFFTSSGYGTECWSWKTIAQNECFVSAKDVVGADCGRPLRAKKKEPLPFFFGGKKPPGTVSTPRSPDRWRADEICFPVVFLSFFFHFFSRRPRHSRRRSQFYRRISEKSLQVRTTTFLLGQWRQRYRLQ